MTGRPAFGRYYCDAEYDLGPLRASAAGGRWNWGGPASIRAIAAERRMFLLWNALADYVLDHDIEILFGVASFHGTDPEALKVPLSWLRHHHLAPAALRVRARVYQDMDLMAADLLDRRAAMIAMPTLIKAYLRLGGFVGDGAFIDRAFNTTDVCLLMDTQAMSARHKGFYTRKYGARA